MKRETLGMILKIREWEEEIEKQKFAIVLNKQRKVENYIHEIEERLNSIIQNRGIPTNSTKLESFFREIQYITNLLNEAKAILNEIEKEVEKQREIYENSFKERKKIEKLNDRLIFFLKKEREKIDEKVIADLISSRFRMEL